jgi:uncharacterized protein YPO0396
VIDHAPDVRTDEQWSKHLDVPDGYVLVNLELYNWGPFAGMHRAAVDPAGTAIIGPTGSGKTTLIDGLMTLLVEQPRYNLASTGGHESDRTLISYVRGVLSGDGGTVEDETGRAGSTYTGLCATYSNSTETLKLAALLWTEGAGNAAQDLKRRWIFSRADGESLEGWLHKLHDESARNLMRYGRETSQLRIFESKKAYLAHVRKFFDVSANAFTLLNRAAGLKQLNSIDEIFRELVLDDCSAFDRALEVAGEFDNLVEIHAELEQARLQEESLLPIAGLDGKRRKSLDMARSLRKLDAILPVWFALESHKHWVSRIALLDQEICKATDRLKALQQAEANEVVRVDALRETYLKVGGNDVDTLKELIDRCTADLVSRRHNAQDYQRLVRRFGLDEALSEAALKRNVESLDGRHSELRAEATTAREAALDVHAELREVGAQVAALESDLERVKQRPGSNIPPNFQDFRSLLAAQLELTDKDVPFVAELVEVKPSEQSWRGAIERAIGPERLRLAVPEPKIKDALQWVNHRDNRLHVRLLEARRADAPARFFDDGFTRKLNFRAHALRESVKGLLAGRDRHCVASAADLRATEHAMTIEGLMSDRSGRFEKQDQRRLNEGWVTGFDNRDQLRQLEQQLSEARVQRTHLEASAREQQQSCDRLEAELTLVARVMTLDFAEIDVDSAQAALNKASGRLSALLAADTDASKAKAEFDEASTQLKATRADISSLGQALAVSRSRRDEAVQQRDRCAGRAGDGLPETDQLLGNRHFKIGSDVDTAELADAEHKYRQRIKQRLEKNLSAINTIEQQIVRQMERAQKIDTGALAETGTELIDTPDYLERLRVLQQEALPEKRGRFLDYLNRSSDQGVTQLLAGIAEDVDEIEQRIAELNATLTRVDFRGGRYLQLEPLRIRHERLRALEAAQRHLRSAALKDDNGDSHFSALRSVIEILREAGQNRRQLGSRALLDPRYRLQFFVVEVDRETGTRSSPRTGSQSGSGGEKELMASHVLTASLSYALCPAEASKPLYGTVVLDEAFSKSSPSAAARIIDALRVFGLHPIFVTPNKELALLRKHTRKVICVHRSNRNASLASISWEALDELSQRSR